MITTTTARAVSILGLLLAACSSDAYDEDWGGEGVSAGKADGLADLAPALAFNKAATGEVDEQQLDLFRIELTRGDRITIVKKVTSGDLSPHFTLFFGTSSRVGSRTFDVEGDELTKTYEIEATGRHVVAVQAFKNQGAGTYRVLATCNGGPCKGELIDEPLEAEDADLCMSKGWQCAFDDMARFEGAVGPTRARSLFEGCMNKLAAPDGASCGQACKTDGAAKVCDAVIRDLPFFADESAACHTELETCMEACGDAGEGGNSEQGVDGLPMAVCWELGSNGTCPGYARELAVCGGELALGSAEECHESCRATTGAWVDDLDLLCVEACGDLPADS